MTIAGSVALLAIALFGFTPASASEVTGTLSTGASAPVDGSDTSGTLTGGVGSDTSGTLSGDVGSGGTISGTVSDRSSNGGSSGGSSRSSGSSGNNDGFGGGDVLGESIELAQANIPGLPNTGGGGEAAARGLLDLFLNGFLVSVAAGAALVERKWARKSH